MDGIFPVACLKYLCIGQKKQTIPGVILGSGIMGVFLSFVIGFVFFFFSVFCKCLIINMYYFERKKVF